MLKRIVSCIMTLVFMAVGIAVIPGNIARAYEPIEAYKLEMLHAVGILDQKSDYAGGAVTRFEGAETVLAMLAAKTDSLEAKSKFFDVRDYTYESAVTSAVSSYGIMVGIDGSFVPEKILTFNEAVKILMVTLGYRDYSEARGGYPEGYKAAAKDIGLLKNVEIGNEDGITQDSFYRMVYNAARIPVLEIVSFNNGNANYSNDTAKTFLEKYHNIFYVEGKITGNSKTELGSSAPVRAETAVKLGDQVYSEGNSGAGRYIGYRVGVYVKQYEEDAVVLWAYPLRKCTAVKIQAGDMLPFEKSAEALYTEIGSKKKTYRISAVADVIYNGKYVAHPEPFNLNPQNGYIELIDDNGDEIYDCLHIYDYITYRVNSIDRDNEIIFDKYMQKPIRFAAEDSQISVEKNGSISDFQEIQTGDVLLVASDKISLLDGYRYIGEDAEIFDIIILDREVTGQAERVHSADDGTTVTVNGDVYTVSAEIDLLSQLGKMNQIKAGMKYRFPLSPDNEIMDCRLCDVELYGYFCSDVDLIEEEDKYFIKFFDLTDCVMQKKAVAKKVTVNGKKTDYSGAAAAFRTDSAGSAGPEVVPQLFIYRENADGEIRYIDTWIYNTGSEDPDASLRLSVQGNGFAIRSGKYTMNHKFVMGKDARVLTVRTRKINGVEELVADATSFTVSDREIADYWASYNVEAYNCNAAGITEMVVLHKTIDYGPDTETEIGGGLMYDNMAEVLVDEEGCLQLNGYTPNGPVSLILAQDILVKDWNGNGFSVIDISQLRRGDIIKYETNGDKCIKLERVFSYVNSQGFYNEYHYYRGSYINVGQSHFAYGKAYAFEENVMRVKFDTKFGLDDQNSYAVLETDGKSVLVYDTLTGKFEFAPPDGVLCASNLNSFSAAYDIVFHTHDMRLDSIYAYR